MEVFSRRRRRLTRGRVLVQVYVLLLALQVYVLLLALQISLATSPADVRLGASLAQRVKYCVSGPMFSEKACSECQACCFAPT